LLVLRRTQRCVGRDDRTVPAVASTSLEGRATLGELVVRRDRGDRRHQPDRAPHGLGARDQGPLLRLGGAPKGER
jgi:hypothetical protein